MTARGLTNTAEAFNKLDKRVQAAAKISGLDVFAKRGPMPIDPEDPEGADYTAIAHLNSIWTNESPDKALSYFWAMYEASK